MCLRSTVCILISEIKRESPTWYLTANIYILSVYSLFPSRWQLVCSGRLWQLLTSRNSGEIWPPGKLCAVEFFVNETWLLPVSTECGDEIKRYRWTCNQCSVSCFNKQSNTWTAIANMLSRRSSAGVAVLDGMLYVAGGNDGTSCLNSVERFNPKTNTWEGVAPMNIRRLVSTQNSYSYKQVMSRTSEK